LSVNLHTTYYIWIKFIAVISDNCAFGQFIKVKEVSISDVENIAGFTSWVKASAKKTEIIRVKPHMFTG